MIKFFLLEKILAMPEHFFLCLKKYQPTFFLFLFLLLLLLLLLFFIIRLNKKLIQRNKTIQHNQVYSSYCEIIYLDIYLSFNFLI
jgi:hypothetical protein